MSDTGDTLKDTAARGVEAITLLVSERDGLRDRCEKLDTKVVVLEQELHWHKQKSAELTVERDHYMRYSTELVARLNNIQVLINDTVKEASRATYKPAFVVKPGGLLDTTGEHEIASLISRLPVNGGSE